MTSLHDVSPALRTRRRVVKVPMKRFTAEELAWASDLIAKDKTGEKLPFLDEVKAYNIRLLSQLRDGISVSMQCFNPANRSLCPEPR